MNIVIIGAGSMGMLFAGLLAKGGNTVTLIAKKKKDADIINKKGIKMSGERNMFIQPGIVKCAVYPCSIKNPELIIIFVKSYDTVSAARTVKKMIGRDTVVLTLQNGLGNFEMLEKLLGKGRVIAGISTHGALLEKPGVVKYTGLGAATIGVNKKNRRIVEKIAENFKSSCIFTKLNKDINSVIWSKLVLNCGINPVAAATGVKNGEVIKNTGFKQVAVAAAKETAETARRLKIKLLYENTEKAVEKVCMLTAENKNSMLCDILKGKKTEIEYLNGAVVKIAKKLNCPVPVNKALYKIVKNIESKR